MVAPNENPEQKKPNARRKRQRINTEEDGLDLKLYTNPWKINKILTQSDLNGLSRLIMPSDQVKTHVLPFMTLENRQKMELPEGIRVPILDLESSSKHVLTFKKWPGSNSYVLVSNWTTEFIDRKKLRKGEEIGMIWEKDYQSFYFMVVREHPRPPPPLPPPSHLASFGCELKLGLPGTSSGLSPSDLALLGSELTLDHPGTSTGRIRTNQNVVIAAIPLQFRSGHNNSTTINCAREDFAQTVKAVRDKGKQPVTM